MGLYGLFKKDAGRGRAAATGHRRPHGRMISVPRLKVRLFCVFLADLLRGAATILKRAFFFFTRCAARLRSRRI